MMAKLRVFQNPDGTVRITAPSAKRIRLFMDEQKITEDEAYNVVMQKAASEIPDLAGLTFIDVDSASLPSDRTDRHKWRISGNKVEADLAVPDKEPPQKEFINKITAATSLDELKIALIEDANDRSARAKVAGNGGGPKPGGK